MPSTPARGAGTKTRLDRAIGARLRAVRLRRGLTAERLGAPRYTRAHVSAIELGKISASVTALSYFAKRLRVRLRDLIPPDA
jgi:transcriptional regulator with XRE-family HTH domain